MPCKADSQCPSGKECVNGNCVSYSDKEKRSFKDIAYENLLDYQSEARQVSAYSRFVEDTLEDAAEARQDEADDIEEGGFWGQLFGTILGAGIGCVVGGPVGCVAGATIGGGTGSLAGRSWEDYQGDAEDVGLTDDELNMLDVDDFKYLKREYWDVQEEGQRIQDDLDDYDEHQWKDHIMQSLDDAWQSFKVASTIKGIADVTDIGKPDISSPKLTGSSTPSFTDALENLQNVQFQTPGGRDDMVPTRLTE